jgi:hypothetical protein
MKTVNKIWEFKGEIEYPTHFSEFEIQAELYGLLRNMKLDVRGELHQKPCRFDLVVFDGKKAVCIIEVKKWVLKKEPTKTKQFKKYSNYGLPVIYCVNMEDVPNTLDRVKQVIMNTVFRLKI